LSNPGESAAPGLARRLGSFDATMIVMGGIIGSGIFVTPHTVAREVPSASVIVAAWACGGLIALAGAFIYAELAARRPEVGGQYAYLRDAYHPAVAFVYGWALLLVIQTGGMAAVAVTFARYFLQVIPLPMPEQAVAVIAVALLVLINCLGVRAGSTVQNILMLLKLAAVALIVVAGVFFAPGVSGAPQAGLSMGGHVTIAAFGAAMIPIMFSYGGWQTASFISGELRNPQRDLARGLVIGVVGVVTLYLLVNVALLRGLGADGLAASTAPATALLRSALGEGGARFIAVGITISTIGFLSQGMLTAPRVYYAMARDGVFFSRVATVDRKTQAPVAAIALQGLLTMVIALSGTFDQILNYVVSVDFIFFGLTAGAVFVFRARAAAEKGLQPSPANTVPGHPYSTGLFMLASAAIVANTLVTKPADSMIGMVLMLTGIPVFLLWRRLSIRPGGPA
jgi:APA family basic amino acid/polyamine antiporter